VHTLHDINMIFLRTFMIVLGLFSLSEGKSQTLATVEDVFPDFPGDLAVTHYFSTSSVKIPLTHHEEQTRPNIDSWITSFSSLPEKPESEDYTQISIYRDKDLVRFVRLRYHGRRKQERIYRVSTDSIALIIREGDRDQLWSNQLGYWCWIWKYGQDGKLIEIDKIR